MTYEFFKEHFKWVENEIINNVDFQSWDHHRFGNTYLNNNETITFYSSPSYNSITYFSPKRIVIENKISFGIILHRVKKFPFHMQWHFLEPYHVCKINKQRQIKSIYALLRDSNISLEEYEFEKILLTFT